MSSRAHPRAASVRRPVPGLVSLERDPWTVASLHFGLYSGVPSGLGPPSATEPQRAAPRVLRRTFGIESAGGAMELEPGVSAANSGMNSNEPIKTPERGGGPPERSLGYRSTAWASLKKIGVR